MALTLDQLKRLVDAQGVKYFVAPSEPTLLMNFGGRFGTYQVIMKVEVDGRFLQFRTMGYGLCPKSHPHCDALLQVLGALDYELRMTKWGWDPRDGEIVACMDMWLEDATLTNQQFQFLLSSFLPAIDLAHQRIGVALETGVDQGLHMPEPEPVPSGNGPMVV